MGDFGPNFGRRQGRDISELCFGAPNDVPVAPHYFSRVLQPIAIHCKTGTATNDLRRWGKSIFTRFGWAQGGDLGRSSWVTWGPIWVAVKVGVIQTDLLAGQLMLRWLRARGRHRAARRARRPAKAEAARVLTDAVALVFSFRWLRYFLVDEF